MVCRSRVQPSLLGEGRPDTRERRKSSLPKWSNAGNLAQTKIREFYSKWREHCQWLFSLFDWLLKIVYKISLVENRSAMRTCVDFIQVWYSLNKWDKLFCFVVIQSLLPSNVLQLYDLRCKLREGESKNLSFQRTREEVTWRVVKCHNWHSKTNDFVTSLDNQRRV